MNITDYTLIDEATYEALADYPTKLLRSSTPAEDFDAGSLDSDAEFLIEDGRTLALKYKGRCYASKCY